MRVKTENKHPLFLFLALLATAVLLGAGILVRGHVNAKQVAARSADAAGLVDGGRIEIDMGVEAPDFIHWIPLAARSSEYNSSTSATRHSRTARRLI